MKKYILTRKQDLKNKTNKNS